MKQSTEMKSPMQKQAIVNKIAIDLSAVSFKPEKIRLVNAWEVNAASFKEKFASKFVATAAAILDFDEKDHDWSVMFVHEISMPIDDLVALELCYMANTYLDVLERELGMHLNVLFENVFTTAIRSTLTMNGMITTTVHQFEFLISHK